MLFYEKSFFFEPPVFVFLSNFFGITKDSHCKQASNFRIFDRFLLFYEILSPFLRSKLSYLKRFYAVLRKTLPSFSEKFRIQRVLPHFTKTRAATGDPQ